MAIVATKEALGNGRAIVTITGLAAVGTSTTGTAEEVPLDDIEITGGEVHGFEVSCASDDYDVLIGRDSAVDFADTPGFASALLAETAIDGGDSVRDAGEELFFSGNLWFRLKNDDTGDATGAITARLLLSY